jgi:hypothetical protein
MICFCLWFALMNPKDSSQPSRLQGLGECSSNQSANLAKVAKLDRVSVRFCGPAVANASGGVDERVWVIANHNPVNLIRPLATSPDESARGISEGLAPAPTVA